MEIPASLSLPLLLVVKIALLVFVLLYIVFAAVVVKQVKLMTETLEVGFETAVKYMSYVHLLISIVVFVLSIIIL